MDEDQTLWTDRNEAKQSADASGYGVTAVASLLYRAISSLGSLCKWNVRWFGGASGWSLLAVGNSSCQGLIVCDEAAQEGSGRDVFISSPAKVNVSHFLNVCLCLMAVIRGVTVRCQTDSVPSRSAPMESLLMWSTDAIRSAEQRAPACTV